MDLDRKIIVDSLNGIIHVSGHESLPETIWVEVWKPVVSAHEERCNDPHCHVPGCRCGFHTVMMKDYEKRIVRYDLADE